MNALNLYYALNLIISMVHLCTIALNDSLNDHHMHANPRTEDGDERGGNK